MTRPVTPVVPGAGPTKSLYAFGVLVTRTGFWVAGSLFIAVGALPWLLLVHPGEAIGTLLTNAPLPEALHALWRDTVQLPLVLGLVAFLVATTLLSTSFGKMLPSAHTLVLRGAMIVGILASTAAAIVHGKAEGVAVGVTAFGVTLVLSTTFLMILRDPGLFRAVRWVLGPGALLVLWRPFVLQDAATAHPWPAACIAVICSGVLLVRGLLPVRSVQGTSAASRAFNDLSKEDQRAKVRWFFPTLYPWRDWSRPWRRSLAAGRLIDWYRAAQYERHSRLPWFIRQLAIALLVASAVALGGMVEMAPLLLLMGFAGLPSPLRGEFLYPISRARRAQLALARTIAWILPECLMTAVALPLFFPLLAPLRAAWFGTVQLGSPSSMPIAMGIAFSLAPPLQLSWGWWRPALPRVEPGVHPRGAWSSLGGFAAVWVVSGAATAITIWAKGMTPGSAIATIAGLTTITYGLYWAALRLDAKRGDLQ